MKLINTMENAVAAQLLDIKSRFPGACFCEYCQQDIMALALNSLPPRYVVTEERECMPEQLSFVNNIVPTLPWL